MTKEQIDKLGKCCLICEMATFTKKDNDKRILCPLKVSYVDDDDCCSQYNVNNKIMIK